MEEIKFPTGEPLSGSRYGGGALNGVIHGSDDIRATNVVGQRQQGSKEVPRRHRDGININNLEVTIMRYSRQQQ